MTTKEILKKICEAPYEHTAESETHKVIEELISPYCEKIEKDALGNLICTVKSEGKNSVVLSAHLDKIGLVVTGIDKTTGMLKTAKAGGVDMRTLAATRVKVLGKKVLYGCITSTPPHLTTGDRNKTASIDSLFVDCGLDFTEISSLVSAGDCVQYHSPVTELLGTRLTGAYMDNAAGCTALINAVKRLKTEGTENKVTAVFTTREEIGKGGAMAVFTRLQPDFALITDVSFGAYPGIPRECSSPLSSGAMICISPILQKEMSESLISIAEKYAVPYTTEIMGSRTMTDSDVAVNAGMGIKTGLISIPLTNMHTPVETLDEKDVDAVSDIMYLFSKGE